MKRAFIFAGLAAATLSFVGCNKEADLAGNGRKIEIFLNNEDTRTVNEGLSTKWEDGDALNVFYAAAGTTEYSSNTEFTVDDAAGNHATGTVELTANAYDWYLLYPYDSHVTTPANTKNGYLTVGSASNRKQTQNGLDSKAHLAGTNLPIYGVAKNVSSTDVPEVTMKHVSSVVAVNLINGTQAPIEVEEVSFTAPEDIVGTYYIDFSGDELGFTGSGASYVSKTASLTVDGDAAIAAGASAKFYLAVKPFQAKANDKLVLKIKVGSSSFEKEVTLPSAVEFAAGHIKTLNISYTGGTEIPSSSLSDIIAMDNGADIKTQEVLVVGKYARGVMLAQNGTYLLAFDSAGVSANVGDIVTVEGVVGSYAGLKQITSPVVEVVSSDNPVVLPDPKVLDGAAMSEYASNKVELIQYTGTLSVSGTYFNVLVPGTDRKGSVQYPLDTQAMTALNGKTITATGFFTGLTSSNTYVNMMSTSVTEAAGNVFEVSPREISVAASATSAEIIVSGNVAWTAEASEGATLDKDHGEGSYAITVSFPANTDTENEKEYTVFVRTEAEGVNDEFDVYITQAKAISGTHFVKVTSASDLTDGPYLIVYEASEGSVAMTNAVDAANNGTAVTITGNSIEATAATRALAFTITFSDGFIQGPNGKFIGQSGDANGMAVSDTGIANTISMASDGVDIACGTNHLRYNTASNQLRFRYYKAASYEAQKPVQLYKLSDGPAPATATLVSIAVTGQKTEFAVGDEFTHDTAVVTATYSDDTTKDVTASATFSSPDMTTAGTKEVTVTYQEGGVTKECKYDITVSAVDPDAKTISMTMSQYVEDNNCTVSSGSDVTMYKTLQLNASVRMSTTGDDNCGSFWNTSSSNTTKQWRLYQNKGGNVIVSVAQGCELKSVKLTYSSSGNGTLLDGAGNRVVSDAVQKVSGSSVTYTVGNTEEGGVNGQVRITAVEVTYTGDGTFPDNPQIETKITMAGNASVYVGETMALNATSNVEGAPITYESEDPSIATVDASGVVTGVAVGTVKVYARIAGVAGRYTDAERYCSVTVSTRQEETEGTVLFDMAYLAANKDGSKGVISYTNSSDYGSTVPTELRVYKGKELVISASGNHKITGIKMTCTKNGTTKEGPGCWGAGAPEGYTFESDGPVGTWSGSASSVSFTATDNQVRITELVVTYE